MRGRTPDRLTAEKGDPNAEHPGRKSERSPKRTSLGRIDMVAEAV